MADVAVRYRMDKIHGMPQRREVYLLNGVPKRIELSPNYSVSQCTIEMVNKVYSDWNFREIKLPSELLENIVKNIEAFKKIDTIFNVNHDRSLLPKIEEDARKIKLLAGQQLGYPYSKCKRVKRRQAL